MTPKLYMIHGSPPCRAVFTTAKALDITLNMHEVHLEKGEHLSPEYLKINPLHSVPALEDNGKIICDSHAINSYLVEKYGKDDSLYPKDLHKKATVNERLFFDAAVLWSNFKMLLEPIMEKEKKAVPPGKAKYIEDSYEVLNKYLEGKYWVAGDDVTIADFNIYTTMTSLEVFVDVDAKSFPNVTAWIKRVKALPWLEGDDKEIEVFASWIRSYKM